MKSLFKKLPGLLGNLANAYTLWPLLPAGVVGVITGYLSSYVGVINDLGVFGWWAAGLAGFALAAVGLGGVATWRQKLASIRLSQNWNLKVDAINPLRDVFERERINVADLAHPFTRRVRGKTFKDCQLFGPANVILVGGGGLYGANIVGCDIVVCKDDAVILNGIAFEDCFIQGGEIGHCTLFMRQQTYETFTGQMPNAQAITFLKPSEPTVTK